MNQADFKELLDEERFSPFVISTHNGFAVAIGPEQKNHILVGKRMVVLLDSRGNVIHVPYRSISTIQEITT